MAVNLSPIWGAGAQLFDNSGNVLSGGKIYTYAAGTTTPATTYTSSNGITANSNPIILNSAGRVPYEIWLSDTVAYKFVLKDSNDTLIATYDNLVGINSNFIAYTAQQEIQTATAGQTVFNLTTMQYQPATNNLSVFVDGVNQYGPGAQYAYVETDSDTVTFVSGLHVGASVKFTTATPVASAVVNAENVAYDPPFTGAVGTNVEAKLAQTVSVKDFGAVGDGVTDDKAAVKAALESGYVVDGGGLTYAIDGTCTPTSFVGLQNANFIQLAPTTANCATLNIVNISNFFVDNVTIDMGSTVVTSDNDSSNSGIYIGHDTDGSYVTNFKLTRVNVTGDGSGSRIQIRRSKRFTVDNCYVYDCYAGYTPDPTNDIVNGYLFHDCADFIVSNSLLYGLYVRISGVYTTDYNRGFTFSECRDFNVVDCNSTSVSQCFDFSGGVSDTSPSYYEGNRRFTISGCTANNAGLLGFAFKNVTHDGVVTGCIANNPTKSGFWFSSQSLSIPLTTAKQWAFYTSRIDVVGCKVVNSKETGFRIDSNLSAATPWPNGIRISSCNVIDNQTSPTTTDAYSCQVLLPAYNATGYNKSIANVLENCSASDGVVYNGSANNFGGNLYVGYGTTTQSIPNGNSTLISWDADLTDPQQMHSASAAPTAVYVKTPGLYRVTAQVQFAANATGERRLTIAVDGSSVNAYTSSAGGSAGSPTTVNVSNIVSCSSGSYVGVFAFQNSGGALNIDLAKSSITVEKVL